MTNVVAAMTAAAGRYQARSCDGTLCSDGALTVVSHAPCISRIPVVTQTLLRVERQLSRFARRVRCLCACELVRRASDAHRRLV